MILHSALISVMLSQIAGEQPVPLCSGGLFRGDRGGGRGKFNAWKGVRAKHVYGDDIWKVRLYDQANITILD